MIYAFRVRHSVTNYTQCFFFFGVQVVYRCGRRLYIINTKKKIQNVCICKYSLLCVSHQIKMQKNDIVKSDDKDMQRTKV